MLWVQELVNRVLLLKQSEYVYHCIIYVYISGLLYFPQMRFYIYPVGYCYMFLSLIFLCVNNGFEKKALGTIPCLAD